MTHKIALSPQGFSKRVEYLVVTDDTFVIYQNLPTEKAKKNFITQVKRGARFELPNLWINKTW